MKLAVKPGVTRKGDEVGEKLRALVVDDHEDVRTMLRRLVRMVGAEVVSEADSGEAALEAIDQHEVDFVVMDLYMPGMGGVEATRALKEAHPEVTVFGFTAWGVPEAKEMLAAGATAVFEKTDTSSLLNAIKQLGQES